MEKRVFICPYLQLLGSREQELSELESDLSLYSGDDHGRFLIQNNIDDKRHEISIIKKKLIFLKARSGYDMEDIVDYF